uniref:Gfo/Idh/MocA-like oxidoreductase N-terminal domain-containing protein n=1 Tax=Panagrolaimus sp. ES5 TaxID=591445 RepID=A0AC34F5N5_9BILA
MLEKLRWGIIGCGNVSGDFAKAINYTTQNNIISAVAARDLNKAQEFVKINDLGDNVKAYGSYTELFKDESCDIVYIGVLNHFHKPLVLEALDNEKHVVCEKPMGLDFSETKEMIEKAKEKGLFLMEGYWTCFFPAFKAFHENLKKIENLNLAISECGFAHHAPNKLEKSLGGGDLMATGCYNIMTILSVFENETIKKITSNGGKNESGVDLWSSILIEFESGKIASIFNTSLATTPSSFFVSGSNGYVKIPEMLWCPTKILVNVDNNLEGFCFKLNKSKDGKEKEFQYPRAQGFCYEQDHVFECLQKG